jgi:hypothetical protein
LTYSDIQFFQAISIVGMNPAQIKLINYNLSKYPFTQEIWNSPNVRSAIRGMIYRSIMSEREMFAYIYQNASGVWTMSRIIVGEYGGIENKSIPPPPPSARYQVAIHSHWGMGSAPTGGTWSRGPTVADRNQVQYGGVEMLVNRLGEVMVYDSGDF